MDWDPIIAIISIIFGILVIAVKDLLNVLVGLFFILLGIWFILQWMQKRGPMTQPQQPQQPQPPQQPRQ